RFADHAYDDPAQRNKLSKALLGVEWPDDWGKAGFLDSVSGNATGAAQGGTTTRLCQSLQQHHNQPIDGVVAFANPPLVPEVAPTPSMPVPSSPAVPGDALGPGRSLRFKGAAPADDDANTGRFWSYQVCTEVGLYQIKNPDRTMSVMSDLTM